MGCFVEFRPVSTKIMSFDRFHTDLSYSESPTSADGCFFIEENCKQNLLFGLFMTNIPLKVSFSFVYTFIRNSFSFCMYALR